MASNRPYFYSTIAELEQLVQDQRHEIATLSQVSGELGRRNTDRASRLRSKVVSLQNGLQLPLENSVTISDVPAGEVASHAPAKSSHSSTRAPVIGQRLDKTEASPSVAKPPEAATLVVPPKEKPFPSVQRETLPLPETTYAERFGTRSSTPPIIVSRMLDLIDYLVAVEKDKMKIVTQVGDHHGFHRSHEQLADLPGIAFNRIDGDETAWLQIERLARRNPPEATDPRLAPWIVVADEPAKVPHLRDTLSAAECARADFAGADQGIALADFPEADAVRNALDLYVAGPWELWAQVEVERRKTIAIYGTFFALHQALAAPDGIPQELVCGIGYAALERKGKRLCYPLLTVALDIELNPISHIIALVPRAEGKPTIEADPLDVLELAQVDPWRKDALRALNALEDDPLSPFVYATFEPILQQAAALLDPNARYLRGDREHPLPLPIPSRDLIVTDTFGFFQRERRATQLMADLLAFRALLESSGDSVEIPPAVAALFTEPSNEAVDEDFPTFRGICSVEDVTSSDGTGEDLFFPKPFNREQVQIAQRLAVRHGVVVQGPPGTGKTHTIANIISHYLATGRRVLVTSQKSPALRVLQDQLPTEIRPLAVSLLDSDRDGLRQFRASVDTISERLQSLSKDALQQQIMILDSRTDAMHRRLATIDHEIEKIGRNALQPVELEGQRYEPITAAREVLQAGDEATWIEDKIDPRAEHDPRITDDDVGSLRSARKFVGEDLFYLDVELPASDFLADTERLIAAHLDLVRADDIRQQIASGNILPLAADDAETLSDAADVEAKLATWDKDRDRLAQEPPPWDQALDALVSDPADPIVAALRDLEDEASLLADDHSWFLTRPVDVDGDCAPDSKLRIAIADLAAGGPGLGTLGGIFARAAKTSLAAARLRGKPPADAEDWAVVQRFVEARERADAFVASWTHACDGTALPALAAQSFGAGREACQLLARLEAVAKLQADAVDLTVELRLLVPRWFGTISRYEDCGSIRANLQAHVDRARLGKAKRYRQELSSSLGNADSPLHSSLRGLIRRIGDSSVTANNLRDEMNAQSQRLAQLHTLDQTFDIIASISDVIAESGAAIWADRLCSEPPQEIDQLCPSDWRHRWRLRRLTIWLDASDQAERLRDLHAERERIEADLSQTYTRLIEQRTWLALKKQASPAVLAALAAYASAVGKIGKGTGKSANRHRNTARAAANQVKGALPCWIMPHHRVSESLPAELGIFDLVIVDEASQSTLASLPALFRAKQILVVGDDKQVSPDNVGLAMDQANALVARHLGQQVPIFVPNMRQETSLYDLASVIFGGDRVMLREHFRCAAPIIEFSKRQFYQNELRPLRLSKASERLDPVLIDVRITDGYRKGKTNPPEADYIVEELGRMGGDPAFEGRTIGVTTLLGTEQAALIYQKIEIKLGIPFIERFHVRVGDPAVFQGDERDVMFLSMVAAEGGATALSGLQYDQRFNVAASRARERMILVRSIDLDQLSPRDMLRRALIEHFRAPFPADAAALVDARTRCESDFEREMFDALTENGFCVDTQVAVGRHRIDMVVEGDDDRRLAIECDGDRYHGPEQWPADIARQRTLERAGWRVWRCFASRFVREREVVLAELKAYLTSLDIQPRGKLDRSNNYTELRQWNSIPS